MSASVNTIGTQPLNTSGLFQQLTRVIEENAYGNLSPHTQVFAGLIGAQVLQDMLAVSASKRNDGVTNANGAPELPPALNDFSGDQLALILAAIDSKIKQGQAKTAKEGIEAARVQKESQNREMLKKIGEAIEKQKEAAAKEKGNKVWGWIGKVAALIGAIVAVVLATVATVLSGGAAAPLLAIAVLGFAAASVDLASQINQEVHPNAKPFTLGSLIGDAIIKGMDDAGLKGKERAAASGAAALLGFLLLQPDLAGQMAEDAAVSSGASPEEAAKIRMGVMIAAVVTTILVLIVATVASGGTSSASTASEVGSAVGKTASAAEKAASVAEEIIKAAKVVGAIAQLASGAAKIGQGVNKLEIAEFTKESQNARAAAKEIEALLLKLQQQSEEQTARLKEIILALEEAMAMFSKMVAAAGDARANIAQNLVKA